MRKLFVILLAVCLTACGTATAPAETVKREWDTETPVYRVVEHNPPETYESADLWMATADPPDYLKESARRSRVLSALGIPICIFRVAEDYTNHDEHFYFPSFESHGVETLFKFSMGYSYRTVDRLGDTINSLASLTSEETPAYFAEYRGRDYLIIGDTAYHLNPKPSPFEEDTVELDFLKPEPVPEYLPELNGSAPGGREVKVVKIWDAPDE